ncbi:MAG: hypothetical protein WA705_24810 [Candidatus Ozemobacteraceae bacterium]
MKRSDSLDDSLSEKEEDSPEEDGENRSGNKEVDLPWELQEAPSEDDQDDRNNEGERASEDDRNDRNEEDEQTRVPSPSKKSIANRQGELRRLREEFAEIQRQSKELGSPPVLYKIIFKIAWVLNLIALPFFLLNSINTPVWRIFDNALVTVFLATFLASLIGHVVFVWKYFAFDWQTHAWIKSEKTRISQKIGQLK